MMKADEKTCKENCNDDILLKAKNCCRLLSKVRGARHLATGLKVAKSLEQLFLARTGLGDEGGSHILLVGVVLGVDEELINLVAYNWWLDLLFTANFEISLAM